MNQENLTKYIINYIKNSKIRGAIMLDGQWGIGKSYFIRNKLYPQLNKRENINCANISLYGIADLAEVSKSIYLQLRLHLEKESSEKDAAKSLAVSTVFRSISGHLKITTSEKKLRKLYHSIDLTNAFIILEDIERSSIDILDILGYVNDLVENSHAKVLLVANEDAILYDSDSSLWDFNKKVEKDPEITKLYYIEKEKTISDTIRFHGNYVTALKTIIWDMDFDENDKKLFTADDSIEIIKDLVSNKESCNLRTFIFACQKTVDIFSKLGKEYNFDFKKNIFYGIIAFSKKLKNNEPINWDADTNLVSLELGNYRYPLFRFCYNYILYQEFEEDDIDNAYVALQDLKQYDANYNISRDEDFNVIASYYLYTEREVNESLIQLEKKLKNNPSLIPIKHYGILANSLTIMHKILNYDYQSILEVMCQNIKGAENKIDSYVLFKFGVHFDEEDEELIYKEITEQLIKSMRVDIHSHLKAFKSDDLSELCKLINSNKDSIIKSGKFASNMDIDEFGKLIIKASPNQIHQARQVFQDIYAAFQQDSYLQEEIHSLDKLKSIIVVIQKQDSLDKIKQLQLKWFIENIDKYIKLLKERI